MLATSSSTGVPLAPFDAAAWRYTCWAVSFDRKTERKRFPALLIFPRHVSPRSVMEGSMPRDWSKRLDPRSRGASPVLSSVPFTARITSKCVEEGRIEAVKFGSRVSGTSGEDRQDTPNAVIGSQPQHLTRMRIAGGCPVRRGSIAQVATAETEAMRRD